MQFWACPKGHSERPAGAAPLETVRWVDGVAHCLTDGCDRTSANTLLNAPSLRAGLADVLDLFGADDVPSDALRRLLLLPDTDDPAASVSGGGSRDALEAVTSTWGRAVHAYEQVAQRAGQEDAAEYWAMASTLAGARQDVVEVLAHGAPQAQRWPGSPSGAGGTPAQQDQQ